MATICKELLVGMPPGELWQRVKNVGNISRLFPNFIPASELGENNSRSCTLADGSQLVERIVTVDGDLRRLAYTITQSPMPLTHHQASMQVFAEGDGSRFVWITDFLPDEAATVLGEVLKAAAQDLADSLAAWAPV
jgi:Polyketide cyclase / dehydrase and lipid transport